MEAIWYIAGIAGVGVIVIVLLSTAVMRRSRTMRENNSQTLDSFSRQHPLRGDQQEPMTSNDSNAPGVVIHQLRGPPNSFPQGMSGVGRAKSDHSDEEYKGD